MGLIETDLDRLIDALGALARRHLETPMLGRTLMQPAEVVSFGHEVVGWLAPLVRCRERLRSAGAAALQLQLGGAVGTLAALGDKGPAVARRARRAARSPGPGRRLACATRRLGGARLRSRRPLRRARQDRPRPGAAGARRGRRGFRGAPGRTRNLLGDAAQAQSGGSDGRRSPRRRAPRTRPRRLLAAMPQAHQRGLGDWQAELAVWPSLFMAAHGAARALADACAAGLEVDAARMRANIDAHLRAIGSGAGGDVEAGRAPCRRAPPRAQLAALEPLTRKARAMSDRADDFDRGVENRRSVSAMPGSTSRSPARPPSTPTSRA